MSRKLSEMEKVLGQTIEAENERQIPGLAEVGETKVLYFSVPNGGQPRKYFSRITAFTDPPFAQAGGVHEDGCKITTPNGDSYYALRFKGDLSGWQQDIEHGANAMNSTLASIKGNCLVQSDGETVDLNACTVEFI
jgi:hypothetical protein